MAHQNVNQVQHPVSNQDDGDSDAMYEVNWRVPFRVSNMYIKTSNTFKTNH